VTVKSQILFSRIASYALALLALALVAGCASLGSVAPSYRTFDAPMARVKPALISTLARMGMMISSLEVRGGREVIKARKAGSEVEIELEPVNRSTTRARIAARTGDLLYDEAAASRIILQTEKLLGGA
jgi:hypothetical protein